MPRLYRDNPKDVSQSGLIRLDRDESRLRLALRSCQNASPLEPLATSCNPCGGSRCGREAKKKLFKSQKGVLPLCPGGP